MFKKILPIKMQPNNEASFFIKGEVHHYSKQMLKMLTDISISGLNHDTALVFGGKHSNVLACESEIIGAQWVRPRILAKIYCSL